ncbi:hypothetical protein KR084_011983 [Drosophila pseudotakahashii]|nr:hypothetical protein KR084_011983 [Drosophila pseudotakahashii]
MSGLTRRRRTAQQILLRRALRKSVGRDQISTELVPNDGGIVVAPSLIRNEQQINRIPERSSSRAVRKLHRILAANPFRHLTERETAGKFPGCELQKQDSRSWRKLKPSEDKPTLSGHSLKQNEHSRGSTRSRHSSSTYPSTWQLNISKAKVEPKENSNGSLEEIINCSILNRTPYDNKLNTPLKSDNSCQCTISKKARRRGRKNKVESRKRNTLEERNLQACGVFKPLKERVYSGEEFNQQRRICKKPSKTSGNPRNNFECSKSCPYQNYGGYSPSESDTEMQADGNPKLRSRSDYLSNIERISKPPSGVDNKWSLKLPSKTEIKEYMTKGARENRIDHKVKYIPQGERMNRKLSSCFCTKGKRHFCQDRNVSPHETITRRRGLETSNVSNDSMEVTSVNVHAVRESYGRNGDKILSQTSLLSSEHFVQRINKVESEDNLSQVEPETLMEYQNNGKSYGIHASNSFHTKKCETEKNPYRNGESSNDSDKPKTRTVTNYNQRQTISYNVGKLPSAEFRQGMVAQHQSKPNVLNLMQSNSLIIESREEKVSLVQSSSVELETLQGSYHEQATSERSNTGTPNKEYIRQAKSGKSNPQTPQLRQTKIKPSKSSNQPNQARSKPQQSKPKGLSPKQSSSLIIETHKEKYHPVQSSSTELRTAPKTKKVIRTRKRKRSRCCSCCSRCSTRKRSVKKLNLSEKSKSQVCENCQCKKSTTKVKKEISKLPTSNDNCDVREILDILQKTVAGLEKQINIRNGFETPKNTKLKYQELLNDIHYNTPHYSYQQENPYSERRKFDQSMGTFQNQLPDSKTSLANIETPTNLYPINAYSGRRMGFDGGNSSNIYKTNSQIYMKGPLPVNNKTSPNSAEILAYTYQNNRIQRDAIPEYEFHNKGLRPANNEGLSKGTEYDYPQEISERKSQPYRNQEPYNEPIGIANETQGQPTKDYNNQSLNQSINPVCLCNTNNPQIEVFLQNPMAKKPITDSSYSQDSKDTTNSGRQYQNEVCRGPEYCPYRSLYNADGCQKNRGPVTFQDADESNGQKPLPICDNSTCAYDLKNSTSYNSPIHPNLNSTQSYPTENYTPKCNPECIYAQTINSESCKGPEYCPYQNNRSVVVTFEDSDKSRNYQDPIEVCVNSTCREAMPYSRSWENPIYPMSNRTQSYPNELAKGKIDCFELDCIEKEKQIPFQKGGTAYNSREFCEKSYCPEIYTFKNDSTWTPNRPQTNKNQNEEELYVQELRECPEQIFQRVAVENCNYSGNQKYFTDPRNQKFIESYKTENCSVNCPTRLKSSRQDDRRRGAPRITELSSNQREEGKIVRTKNNREPSLDGNKKVKRYGKPKKDYNNDHDYDLCENSNCPDENRKYWKRIYANSSFRIRMERQQHLEDNKEDGNSSDLCPNRESITTPNSRNKHATSKFCENPKYPDRLKILSKKENFSKDSPYPEENIRYKTQRYEQASQNLECSVKKEAIKDPNKYPTNVDHYHTLDSERKYGKQLCGNTKCADKKNMHRKQSENGYAAHDSHKVSSQRRSLNSYKKHKKIPNTICADPNCPERSLEENYIQYEEDPDLYRTDGYIRQRYRHNNDINNGEKQLGNRIKVCGNSECPKRLRKVGDKNNYRDPQYENEVSEDPRCPNKINKKLTQKEYEYMADTCDKDCSKTKTSKKDKDKMAQGRNPCDMGYDTDDLDLSSMDCPDRYRVLFTDLRRCKNKEKNTSRQSSGRADIYDDNQIKIKACNTCKRYIPLERDRRAINNYCNPYKIEAEIKNNSVESLVRTICISPGKEAPIFVKNRHNPLVIDPIFNSYDKHILDNFKKFKEMEKNRKCVEDCPLICHIEDKKKCSSDCSCEIKPQENKIDSPCDCQIEEFVEYEDPKKTKSKVSFFGCCTKPPKDESKSNPEGQVKPEPIKKDKSSEIKRKEKTESKSSGFVCFKKKDKYPEDESKQKERTESKSSGFSCFKKKEKVSKEKPKPKEKTQSKSSGFSCFKKKEKVPQENSKPRDRSPSNKSSDFLFFKKTEKRPKDNQIKNEKSKDASKPPSKRSGFFSWCRKSETRKDYNRKSEEVPLETKCACSDEEIPMLRPEVPFRCPCAPDDLDDGDVKVLYDSSFRFQKESCSCADVQKKVYCHNNPQTPGQDTSDWYATSRPSSVIPCRQKIEEQEIRYCPCASANGFYKIVQ